MEALLNEIKPGIGIYGMFLCVCLLVWAVGRVAEGVDKQSSPQPVDLTPDAVAVLCGGTSRQLLLEFARLLRDGHLRIDAHSGIHIVNAWPPNLTVLQRELMYAFASQQSRDPEKMLGFEEEIADRKAELQSAGLWVPGVRHSSLTLFALLIVHRLLAVLAFGLCTFATLYVAYLPLNLYGQGDESIEGLYFAAGFLIFLVAIFWVYRPLSFASRPANRVFFQTNRGPAAGLGGWLTPQGRALFECLSSLGQGPQLAVLLPRGADLEMYRLAILGRDYLCATQRGVPETLWWEGERVELAD